MGKKRFWVFLGIFLSSLSLLYTLDVTIYNDSGEGVSSVYFVASDSYTGKWGSAIINNSSGSEMSLHNGNNSVTLFHIKFVDTWGKTGIAEYVDLSENTEVHFNWSDDEGGYIWDYSEIATAEEAEATVSYDSSGDTLSAIHTKAEIIKMYEDFEPSFSGTPYSVTPSVSKPYKTGTLKTGFLEDGLNTLNFCRYLTGLNYDIELDDDLNDDCQHGAVIMAANKDIDHFPPKPTGMSDDFFTPGYNACGSANIACGYDDLVESVLGWMEDSDSYNIDRLGHRRWILYPYLGDIGFGFASDSYGYDYSLVYVFDYTSSDWSEEAVCWPAPGAFPVEFFGNTSSYTADGKTDHAWSVSLNLSYFRSPVKNNIEVTLTRVSDGESWTLDKGDSNTRGAYFNVETTGYGLASCIIFRPPSDAEHYVDGEVYQVEITGLKDINNKDATMSYTVEFFELQ